MDQVLEFKNAAVKIFSLLIILTLSMTTQAQTNAVVVTQEVANQEAQHNSVTHGFENVYFGKTDLDQIMSDGNCTMVRFYTALKTDGTGQTQIAVGINDSGNELGNYLRADGNMATTISAEEAVTQVEASKASPFSTVVCTYAVADINNIVMEEGATGLHVKPANVGGQPSLTLGAATMMRDGSGAGDSGTSYLKSEAPCPTMCGDGFMTNLND